MTERVVLDVVSWLSDDILGGWLLVFDNADNLDYVDLYTFFPTAASRRILITSRNADSHHFGIGREILSLTEEAAVQLLLKKAGKQGKGKVVHLLRHASI